MNVKEFNESISKIAVDPETKQGILEVITITNASNMDTLLNEFRVINLDFKSELRAIREKSDSELKEIRSDFKSELRAIQEKSDSEFREIRSEFKIMNSELKEIQNKSDSEFREIRSEFKSEFKTMYSELKRIESKNDTKTTLLMSFIGFLVLLMIALKFVY